LISNIHARGVAPTAAAERILRLAERLMHLQTSGVTVKEEVADGLINNAAQSEKQALPK
jgi:hypothetical protein